MKRGLCAALFLALLGGLLTGCGESVTPAPTTTTATSTTTAATTATSAEATTTTDTESTTTQTEGSDMTTTTTASTAAPTTKPQTYTSTTTTKATTTKATTTTLAAITTADPYEVALTDARLHYEGRTAVEGGSVLLDWTGAGVTMQVQGGDVRVKLTSSHSASSSNAPCFAVYVNGRRKKTLTANATVVWHTLATGLPTNKYTTISIVKLSEAMFSTATLQAIELTGALGPKPALPDRKMLILGDSITCGWGTKTEGADAPFTTATEDGSLTYGWLLADRLNAQKHILSVSGNGLATSNTGSTTSALLPQQLPFVHFEADYSGPQWDADQYQPAMGCRPISARPDSRQPWQQRCVRGQPRRPPEKRCEKSLRNPARKLSRRHHRVGLWTDDRGTGIHHPPRR